MKAVLAWVLLVHCAMGGEISDFYYKDAKQRSDAASKRSEDAFRAITNEPEIEKRIKWWETHRGLWSQLPPTGGFLVFTNNGQIERARVLTNHGVSEFGLERKGFAFTVTSDGKCRLIEYPVKRPPPPLIAAKPTEKAGTVSLVEFHRMAQLLVEIQFWDLEDKYDAAASDYPTVFSTAVRNGKRKTIRDYAGAGPSRLWAFEQLVDAMIGHVRWDASR